MVMDGVITPRTPLTAMHANGIGAHHGETAKAVLTPTLMVLQTLQPVADLNGTLRMVQMLGHLMALNGQIQMVMATGITVQKVLRILTDSLTT